MDGPIDILTIWLPLVVNLYTFLGICVTIFLLGWRIPGKADISALRTDMNRADDKLEKRIDGEIANLTNALNQGLAATLAVTHEIREDMRQMRSEIQRLADKIDSTSQALNNKIDVNSQASHVDTRKLTEQLNNVANDLRAEIREQVSGNTENV